MSVALSVAVALLLLAAVIAVGMAAPTLWRGWRRHRITRQPFPGTWREILRRRVPHYLELPAPHQRALRQRVQVLLAEVPFIGCDGLVIDDEIRVTIAGQAAFLLLGRGGSFGALREVLVYPAEVVVPSVHTDGDGVVHERRAVLAGQSWQQGRVVLAWDAVLRGAADPHDGTNVVMHEFAHQIDQETGPANGAPYVGRGRAPRIWERVMSEAFAALQARLARGEEGLIDPYGATNPAEFLAVTTELFFERPQALAEAHPALYAQLRQCYRVDPVSW